MRFHYVVHRSASLLLLALLLVAPLAANTVDIRDVIKRSYDVRPGGTLQIDIDRGNIDIETTSGNTVYIELERLVEAPTREAAKKVLEAHNWDMDKRGDDVMIESRFEGDSQRWRRWRNDEKFRLRVRVRVPEQYNVTFSSGAGNVTITDVRGSVEGRTGAGNITLTYIDGDVDIHSGSGNIGIDGASGSVTVHSGAGNVNLNDIAGTVRANTGAGNIIAKITQQFDGSSRFESGAGNVTVYLARGVAAEVDAVASVGSASTDFDMPIEGKWMHKSFSGNINGGGPALRMRSGVGNVTLRRL